LKKIKILFLAAFLIFNFDKPDYSATYESNTLNIYPNPAMDYIIANHKKHKWEEYD